MMLALNDFERILEYRFSDHVVRSDVRRFARTLSWVSRRLPERRFVRTAIGHTLAPLSPLVIRKARAAFDHVLPTDEKYWEGLARQWREKGLIAGDDTSFTSFHRAIYAWLGIEGSAMYYPKNWCLKSLSETECVEWLYTRDENGKARPGCPWGLTTEKHGFACRTLMMATQDIFRALGSAEMKIDITMPEMLASERMITDHLRDHPRDTEEAVWQALRPELIGMFRWTMPEEKDFLKDGELRQETEGIVRMMIRTRLEGKRQPIFCQFRLVKVG